MNTFREFTSSVRRTILGTFDPMGRATRLDIFFWLAANAAVSIVIDTAQLITSPDANAVVERRLAEFIGIIPFFALLARRLHDQDRTGWWVLLLPPLAAMNFYETIQVNLHAFDPRWPDPGYWKIVLVPGAIGYLVLMFLPGTSGANRYGPDPRQRGEPIAARLE